ncbi:MAG: phosphoglucosamine mutase [Desulfobulbia bacterium]
MRKLFGTDGVRGVANTYPMTTEIAMQIGRALAFLVKDMRRGHRIVIGKDTRLSCYMIENALAAGICSMGVDVLLVGPLPTPGIAFITTSMRADAGVVISASHNPFQDNGIKIFARNGFKLHDDLELEIEDLIFSQKMEVLRPVAEEVGRATRIDDAKGRYIVFLKNSFPREYTLDAFHIVLDCANGATYGVAPHVFEELGATVTTLAAEPDGTNINRDCGALHPEHMAAKVRELGADIGIALDGDGDRIIVADEHGNIVDGDHIMAICAADLMSRKKLKKKTLVATVMSNLGLEVAMQRMGGAMVRTQVGDRYVVEEMRRSGYNFGGEQSGHLVFMEHNTTGDGILAALQLLAVMIKKHKPLSELAAIMESFPQVLKNVRTAEKINTNTIPGFNKKLKEMEKKLDKNGRILVRPSGTEPVIRVMVEGQDAAQINAMADELCEMIRKADTAEA